MAFNAIYGPKKSAFFTLTSRMAKFGSSKTILNIEVDKELEAMGISRQEMIVGFHHPLMRPYSDFAVS